MDFQHRPGGKTGSGGVASSSESNRDRRERLRQLALETIDINKVWEKCPLVHRAPYNTSVLASENQALWSNRYLCSLPGPIFYEKPSGIL